MCTARNAWSLCCQVPMVNAQIAVSHSLLKDVRLTGRCSRFWRCDQQSVKAAISRLHWISCDVTRHSVIKWQALNDAVYFRALCLKPLWLRRTGKHLCVHTAVQRTWIARDLSSIAPTLTVTTVGLWCVLYVRLCLGEIHFRQASTSCSISVCDTSSNMTHMLTTSRMTMLCLQLPFRRQWWPSSHHNWASLSIRILNCFSANASTCCQHILGVVYVLASCRSKLYVIGKSLLIRVSWLY